MAETAFVADGSLKNKLYEKNLQELLDKTFDAARKTK
jgi:hypothetical protein